MGTAAYGYRYVPKSGRYIFFISYTSENIYIYIMLKRMHHIYLI